MRVGVNMGEVNHLTADGKCHCLTYLSLIRTAVTFVFKRKPIDVIYAGSVVGLRSRVQTQI